MSRPVTLFAGDATTVLGNVNLPSDFPSDPNVLEWRGQFFVAGTISFSPSPGHYESYIQQDIMNLKDDAVSAPDVAPTN